MILANPKKALELLKKEPENYDIIIKNYKRLVYPRHGVSEEKMKKHENIEIINAPRIEISSSLIRKSISEGKTLKYLMPAPVWDYIDRNNFYR